MEQFKEKGWYVTENGFKQISENGKIGNFSQLLKTALNTDLRDFCGGGFPTDLKGNKFEVPSTGLVVQIVKTRNIAAPKSNQESKFAPRLLKIQFTDGQTQYSGIEIEHISALHLDTKPGTKIFFKPGKVIGFGQDLLLLKQNQFDVLGGYVSDMVEKWEVARKLSKYAKGIRSITQAPPWIPFGQKIDNKQIDLNTKKSSNPAAKPEVKEDNPFDNQRKEAIAEVSKMAANRVFSEGARKLEDHNLKRLLEKGYDEESAKNALRYTKNDFGKAASMLKRSQTEDGESYNSRQRGGGGGPGGRDRDRDQQDSRKRRGRGGRGRDNEEEEQMAKPSQKISLFDFIGDKIPNVDSSAKDRFENNISSSFASRQKPEEPVKLHQSNSRNNQPRERDGFPSQEQNNRNRRNPQQQHQQQQGYRSNDFNNDNRQGRENHSHGNEQRGGRGGRDNYRQNQGPSRSHHQENNARRGGGGGHNQQMNNLVQETQRMAISHNTGNRNQSNQRQANGFPNYDPNRIPGFQNREANEAALKLLQQQQQQALQQSNASQQQMPQQHHQQRNDSKWHWKVGDRCLAKYWEDGRYYNAEITGLTGRTCVVHFMEYGNYEEVLKDDCLPITTEGNENFSKGY